MLEHPRAEEIRKWLESFPDFSAGAISIASDATLHLAPPAAVLLQSDDIADLAIPGLPQGTILIKSKMVPIPDALRGKRPRSRSKPGFNGVTHRTGPLCTPAFAMTDQRARESNFPRSFSISRAFAAAARKQSLAS